MVKVTVTVNTNATPPTFAFDPMTLPIKTKKETIHWTRAHDNFTFAALEFDHTNPFSNVVVSDREIRADDDNEHEQDHPYAVLVNVKGAYYNSKNHVIMSPGPIIRNN